MLLKNLMEDKQLNFYQPLLSVRRFSSTTPSEKDEKKKTDNSLPKIPPRPNYKSELKSGPIRNAGTVPFVWEQSPGRPKDESRPQNRAVERPPFAPKLPPGRILKTQKQEFDKFFENSSVSKHRGEVASNKNVIKLESSKDRMEAESSDSGEGDEEYLDALDTLSRTESFFLNCSESGISGLESTGVNTSGNFSTDPQTRDFMMGRFLPAAKAMTSKTPQHVPKKQPVVREQPLQMMKVVSEDNRPPLRYGHNVLPHYAQEKYEEESDDDYDDLGQLQGKACGLLPRFCLKSSFCLLNPVLGMSVRTRVPMSPSSRMHGSSSSAGSCSENEIEQMRTTVSEQRSVGDPKTAELHKDTTLHGNQAVQLSCPFNPKLEGSALYRRLQGGGTLSHNYEPTQSAFSEQKVVPSIPTYKKGSSTFQELSADPSSTGEVDLGSPMIEKTLYVDTVHKVESPCINSYDSDKKGLPNLKANNLKNLENWKTIEETPIVDSSIKDTQNLKVDDEEANMMPISQKHVDFSVLSLADNSNEVMATSILKGFMQYEDLKEDFSTFAKSKASHNVDLDFETQKFPIVEDLEKSDGSYFGFPIPPPLPKSPSDSWLWRTLPSMSSRSASLQAHLGKGVHPGNQASKTSSVDPKTGTIVKTTKGQHQHVRFPEELLTPIPET